MATLQSAIQFTGTLGNLVAYRLPGSDKIHIRRKSVRTKEMMLSGPSFELSLQNASEFGISGKAAGLLRHAMLPVAHLRAPGLNINAQGMKIISELQKLDTVNKRGERAILFSQFKHLITGFNLHPQHPLEQVITTPIIGSIDRDKGFARISLPALIQNINLHLPWHYPMYRFVMHLGVLPDVYFADDNNMTGSMNGLNYRHTAHTAWHFTRNDFPATTITLPLSNDQAINNVTLVLSAGIELGVQVTDNLIETAKKAGCAKVLAVG